MNARDQQNTQLLQRAVELAKSIDEQFEACYKAHCKAVAEEKAA